MSYVPATFTAGFALMLTAAGAVGGQWVSETFALDAEPPRAEVRTVAERPQPVSRTTNRQAELTLETPRLPALQVDSLPPEAVLRSPEAEDLAPFLSEQVDDGETEAHTLSREVPAE